MMGRGSIAELPMATRFTRRELATVCASALGASATAVPSGARARDGAVAGREASRAFPAGFLWGTATRVTALLMLRSTMKTVSAPASRSFRGSLPHPTQPLCTLRVRRHRRLTQHSLPGGLLDLTWAGLAPADRASFAWRLPSFDHLVGQRQQLVGDFEAERLSRLGVDHQLELCRQQNRQSTRRLAFEDAASGDGGQAVCIVY